MSENCSIFIRFLFGDSAPLFALIGICLASGTGILTKDDELEGVCWEIRVSKSKSLTAMAINNNSFISMISRKPFLASMTNPASG